MVKVIVFVKRNPALSPEAFHRHWREVHARLVAGTPSVARHILRYEQNPRSADDYARGEVEFDGVAIAWYRSREDMEALFAEPEYLEKIQPDEAYLSDAARNVWIVTDEEHVVVDHANG
jgi:uncharacterized protein (TIGR02118 family)